MEDINKANGSSNDPQTDSKFEIKDEMYWWLNTRRPFYIGNEYKILLDHIDRKSGSVKILVVKVKSEEDTTNLGKLKKLLKRDDEKSLGELLSSFKEK